MSIYSIYKATNKINGKCYIGFDSCWPKRKYEHFYESFNPKSERCDTEFHKAIREYGKDAFEWEVIYQGKGDKSLGNWFIKDIEPFFIKENNSFFLENGYNMTRGGEGWLGRKHSEETKKKIGQANTGNKHFLGKTPWNKGKSGYDIKKGQVPWNKGKIGVYSKETIQKMSEARKKVLRSQYKING